MKEEGRVCRRWVEGRRGAAPEHRLEAISDNEHIAPADPNERRRPGWVRKEFPLVPEASMSKARPRAQGAGGGALLIVNAHLQSARLHTHTRKLCGLLACRDRRPLAGSQSMASGGTIGENA